MFFAFLIAVFAALIILTCPKAATDAVQLGINGRVYRNTGTWGSPTWTAVNRTRNVTSQAPWNMADASTRESSAVLEAKTQIKIGGSIEARISPADAGYLALLGAATTRTPIDLLIISGLITTEGVKGFRGNMNINLDSQPQQIGDVIYDTFSYSPAFHTDGYPSYADVGASSAVTYTAY